VPARRGSQAPAHWAGVCAFSGTARGAVRPAGTIAAPYETENPMRVLVLGVGNVLLTDEGVGPHTITELTRRYEFPPEVRLIDGGTSAMELLDDMARNDLLLIVDAVRTGAPPGTLVKLEGEQVPKFFTTKLSPHQVGLSDVLATLMLTGESPKETVIVGVVPDSLKLAMELSPTVAPVVPQVIETVLGELRRIGVEPQAKAA
jgi:hydrogenase maturation protease